MDDRKKPMGLLGFTGHLDESPAALELERQARFLAQLDIKKREIRQLATGLFQALRLMGETKFTQKLYDFAIENNVSFHEGDWQNQAIRLAGQKYISALTEKKKRGRKPEKTKISGGLLHGGGRAVVKGERDYYDVEAVMQAFAEGDTPCRQIDACRIVAKERGAVHEDVIETRAKAIEKAVGSYRKSQGMQLTPGRPKGLKNINKVTIKYRKK